MEGSATLAASTFICMHAGLNCPCSGNLYADAEAESEIIYFWG